MFVAGNGGDDNRANHLRGRNTGYQPVRLRQARAETVRHAEAADAVLITACRHPELAFANQAAAEVGVEGGVVPPEESGKLEFLRGPGLSDVVGDELGGMGLIALARVDRVSKTGNANGYKPRHYEKR